MTDTPVLALPLLQPAQAQKHVTVNEALSRIDGLTQLSLISVDQPDPPVSAADGVIYALPGGATGDWTGQDGRLALRINGGWEFITPVRGWRAFVMDQGNAAVFDGAAWRIGAATLTPGGTSMGLRSVEIDVVLSAGATMTTPVIFPERSIAFGVTGRVTDAITGSATSWDLGVSGDLGRYGTGLGLDQNSWVNGPGTPTVYWTPTELQITAQGGTFAGGTVRLVAHFAELALPDPV